MTKAPDKVYWVRNESELEYVASMLYANEEILHTYILESASDKVVQETCEKVQALSELVAEGQERGDYGLTTEQARRRDLFEKVADSVEGDSYELKRKSLLYHINNYQGNTHEWLIDTLLDFIEDNFARGEK